MNEQQLEKFTDLLVSFFVTYEIKLTESTLKMWIDAFRNQTLEATEGAFTTFNQRGKSYGTPKPQDVFSFISGTLSVGQRSQLAWPKVRAAIRQVGRMAVISFDDLVVTHVIRQLGGWGWLCDRTVDEMKWIERDFHAAYELAYQVGRVDASPLVGVVDRMKIPQAREVVVGLPAPQVDVFESTPLALPAPTMKAITHVANELDASNLEELIEYRKKVKSQIKPKRTIPPQVMTASEIAAAERVLESGRQGRLKRGGSNAD